MKKKGEITVFLVLILLIMSSFIQSLLTIEHRYAEKCEAAYAADNAIRSCFAEYNRELFDRYHILLIDSSYKGEDAGEDNVMEHLQMYLQESLSDNGPEGMDMECKNAAEDDAVYMYDAAVRYAKNRLHADDRLSKTGDEVYFLTYLLDVFGNRDDPSYGCVRTGEEEYLLYGYESDEDNMDLAQADHGSYEDMSYDDFLCGSLEKKDIYELRSRYMFLVSEYLRHNGSPGFDPEKCYYDITCKFGLKGETGEEYTVARRYTYELSDP